MGVTARLVRFGYACPRPLLVAVPGATRVRLAVEQTLRRRGGVAAASPADADTLLVCGEPGPELAAAVDRAWQQIPRPRTRLHLDHPAGVGAGFDETVVRLADVPAQRSGGHHLDSGVQQDPSGSGDGHDHGQGHEHTTVAGLPMAERAPDRDGLNLDRLQVQLGPVLSDWPAGLVLHVGLQGDVVQEARVEVLVAGWPADGASPFWDRPALAAAGGEPAEPAIGGRLVAAAHLDSLGRLLGVAGWADAAVRARRLRDDVLTGTAGDRAREAVDARELSSRLDRLARRVRGSRTLRWLLGGVGVLSSRDAVEHGVSGPALRADGDVRARLLRWLEEAQMGLAHDVTGTETEGPRGVVGQRPPSAGLLEVLPSLVTGLDLAGARLVVASLDPDLDQLVGVRSELAHG